MRRSLAGLVSVALLAVALTATPGEAQQPTRLTQFLRQSIGLDASQMAAIDGGTPVVKTLETTNPRDVAVFGIIATSASREVVVRRIKDLRTSLATQTRVRFGIFSDPAVQADVQSLVIDAKDAEDAKKCRPGDCSFKLAGAEMARIQREVDWNAKDMQAQLSGYAQRRLIEYVTAYRARGDSAIASYDDRGNVNVSASAAFASLLSESPYVYQYAPTLANYLRNYPRETLAGTTEAIFWAEDALPRLRRTLNVNHVVVLDPPGSRMTVVATKQIYAKHYFEAAFDLMSVIERDTGGGSYIIVLRRYRFDNLPSGGLLNIKGRVLNSLKEKMSVDLAREKSLGDRAAN